MEKEDPDSRKEDTTPVAQPKTQTHHFWQYCVNCGVLLESRKCRLVCPNCGFYHSCSEP